LSKTNKKFLKNKKYYYIYRITNIKASMHYYGYRSCFGNPYNDLGKKYFSSSSDKNFINEQNKYPERFKYKIIKIFDNKEDALKLEIKLYHKFNVDKKSKIL
jgi:hypothetical protein